jgi:E3 ubiquitin-protein ligase UBR1
VQQLDLAEDFIHLLIILLSDRTHLRPITEDPTPSLTVARRDIIHALCSKPLSHSELSAKLSDKISDSIEFGDLLEEMTVYRAPEGLNDVGTFALKDDYYGEIEPYLAHFNRNQREEADLAYRKHIANKTGKDPSEIVFEPRLIPIQSGLFKDLAAVTRTRLFGQVIYMFLSAAMLIPKHSESLTSTKVEQFLQYLLHLILLAVLEDRNEEPAALTEPTGPSFCTMMLCHRASRYAEDQTTIAETLRKIGETEIFKACEPKVRIILRHLRHKRPALYASWMHSIDQPVERSNTASPASSAALEKELKKKQALARQAKVMEQFKQQQATFMANQMDWGDEEDFSDPEVFTATPTEEEAEKFWKFPTGTCILCQEETTGEKLYGTFCLINNSYILRDTDLRDPDWMQEVADTPVNLDRSAESMRPFGVSGKNKRLVRKITADGRVQEIERQELGKGFPNRHSAAPGPVATGCGHIMHYSCFENFVSATHRRHMQQIARNHPERLDRNEFLCPLCKALGNAFLPIIWNGKQISYPGVLQPESSFDQFLTSHIGGELPSVERNHQGNGFISAPGVADHSNHLFLGYSSEAIIAPLADQLPQLTSPATSFHTPTPPPPRVTLLNQLPTFLQFGTGAGDLNLPAAPGISSDNGTVPPQLMELVRVYQRLRDTLHENHIPSRFLQRQGDDLTFTDSLANALAYSVAAVEIAQRGVESSPEATLLEKISVQCLTHLRVLSETVTTYIAIGALRAGGANATYNEFSQIQRQQLHQLLCGHRQLQGVLLGRKLDRSKDLRMSQPLLVQDPFTFLVEAGVYLAPTLHLDIHHIMRLCYLAEVVRVILRHEDIKFSENEITRQTKYPESFLPFALLVHGLDRDQYDPGHSYYDMSTRTSAMRTDPSGFYKIVETYALPFLRKCTILMHVRYGVEFPSLPSSLSDEPELTRLSKLLNLPNLDEMFSHAVHTEGLRDIMSGWLKHRKVASTVVVNPGPTNIALSHPAIFELVGLPKTFDTLQDEVMKRRCPTTGKDLTDPCVCLFCGEIFCGQALCCTNEDQHGGCYQHRVRYVMTNMSSSPETRTRSPIPEEPYLPDLLASLAKADHV